MKIKLFTIILLLACMQVSAQHTEKIIETANAWAAASNGKDCYERAKYLNPRFFGKGGVDKWVSNCAKSRDINAQRIKAAASSGVQATSQRDITFETPEKLYELGEEIYCVVPFGFTSMVYDWKYTH
jgi:hypothetical protein